MTLKPMRPLPPATFEVSPTRDEVEFFAENGFIAVDRITTDEEIDWLTELYEHIFDPLNAGERGAPVDRSTGQNDTGPPLLTQAFMPEFNYPQLLETVFNRNARRYAAALLGVEAELLGSWGHMIRKMPGGRAAPWHQDEAYWEPEFRYHALGCWLPLHDVDEEMGAMQFIPGSHRHGVFEHHAKDGDVAGHLLTVDIDTSNAVVCPLTKGGATFHHARTLHFTAPNQTDRPRLAWPTEFEVAPTRRHVPASRPWVTEWRAVKDIPAPTSYVADGKLVTI